MLKKHSYKSIISFLLIVGTILTPMSFLPKKVEAQYGAYGSLGVSGYVRGLAPAIAKLPQCKAEIGSGIKKLFNGIFGNGETGGGIYEPIDETTGLPISTDTITSETLDEKTSTKTIQVTTPGVSDKAVLDELKKLGKTASKIDIQTAELNAQSSCIASIGRLVAKMLLQKLTQSTVNWINSGYDGSPSFIQNPEKFFNDIAKKEILQFGVEIKGINPYSKDWMRSNALALKNKFADNARYSLNEMIATTTPACVGEDGVVTGCAEKFTKDFSVGGWDAWTAMTQVPANNPLGAKLLFDNEIQKRLAGTSQSTAQNTRDALQTASGFLGDQRCISAETGRIDHSITQAEDLKALNAGKPALCTRWEYITPGKMIADAATNVMNYPNNSFLNVQDLNDAVAAVSDAILSQFSTSIYEKGFSNLDYQGIDGVLVFKDTNTDFRTQTQKDYMPSQLSSSWLQANPDFNIRTDLTQALIDEQRTYSDKLALQNKELMSTDDGKDYVIKTDGKSNAYGLMPAIYQLDYCIPGPHPGWEDDSRETMMSKVNSVSPAPETLPNTAGNLVNGAIGVGLNFVPAVGGALSATWGMLSSMFGGDAERSNTNARQHFTGIFKNLTGYGPQAIYGLKTEQVEINMSSTEGLSYAMNTALDRYIKIMNKTYFSSPTLLPEIIKEAAKEFDQLPGYNQIINDNKNKMLEIKTTVSILGEIKNAVDDLNTEYKNSDGQFKPEKSETDYENALKVQINAFGRLSAGMVNGDDIASADDLAQQIVLKKNYIYKNLLKGPYGCEAFLENPNNIKQFPSAGKKIGQPGLKNVDGANNNWDQYNVNSVKRMTYPFPIIYDYNNFAKEETLPDPWTNCSVINPPESCSNKMPAENKYNEYGPGFLSFVYFGAVYDYGNHTNNGWEIRDSDGRTYSYAGDERLSLNGLVNDFSPCFQSEKRACSSVSVGKGNFMPPFATEKITDGLFEKTIGIY